ncbi:MAG: chromosomal replication initiator protein DnaA [Actinomycetota bacterium]
MRDEQLRLEIEEAGELGGLWQEVLARVEGRIGREAVESWLRDTTPVHLDGERLRISLPSATARTWVDKKYSPALREALCAIYGEPLELELVVGKGGGRAPKSSKATVEAPRPPARPAPSALFAPIPLNEKYTFENFVVGQSNRFAQAAANAVAEQPGREFNPLFIYGGVGLGKTHLLQAVGHALQARNPNTRVAYVSGETFTSHFVTSLRERREEDFRRTYRGVDIWLVDDIQFIADKTSTKEEFFHTFNELYLTNRQIVLASDRPPRELRLMEDRLRTRLESGLMVEIGAPELETRVAILEKRAAMEGAEIPPEVLYQIARAVSTNIRVLEAALIRMLALASLYRSSITQDLAARALAAFVQEGRMATINWIAVRQAVCDHFKVGEDDLISPRRDRQTCLARQVAMYLMRELSRKSLSEIGQLFGGKAHSTVLYACDKLEKEMKQDASLEAAIRGLRTQIAGASDAG